MPLITLGWSGFGGHPAQEKRGRISNGVLSHQRGNRRANQSVARSVHEPMFELGRFRVP